MKKARVHIPITLDVDPAAFQGDNLEQTAQLLAANLAAVLRTAESELLADGFEGERNTARVTFGWEGPGRRTFSEKERRAIEQRLKAAVTQAAAMTPRLPKPVPAEGYTAKRIEFEAEFFGLMVLAEAVWPAIGATWRILYIDQLDQKVHAAAWVVTIERAISWTNLYWQLRKLATESFGEDGLFTYLWDATRAADLRELDKRHLRALPTLAGQEMTAVAPDSATKRDWLVPVGVTVVFVAANLPELVLTDYIVFAALTVRLTFFEALTSTQPILAPLSALFKFDDVIVALLDLYGDQPLKFRVWPFMVTRKPISPEAVRIHLVAEAAAEYPRATQLGELVPLTPSNEASYPAELLRHARAWSGATVTPDPLYPGRDWQPGVRGVYFYPLVDDRSFAKQIGYARQWSRIQLDADAVIQIFGDYKPFWAWAVDARNRYDAELWELFLLALDRKGKLGAFFDAWLEHNLYPVTFRPLIALTVKTRFRHNQRLQRVIDELHKWQGGLLKHTYDVDQQRIRLFDSDDSSDWIQAAGSRTDHKAGVVAETSSYYSEIGKVKRPKKATLERLSEPVRKKVGDLMARLVCEGNETMTEDEIFAQAFKEAAKDANLGKDDFESAELRASLRVLKLENRTIGGVTETYVHWQQVRRFEGGEWEKAGEVEVGNAFQFEAALLHYHLQHLMRLLAIGVLVFAVVGTAVALVALTIATIGEIIIAIVISEAIYLWTNRHEGYTLEGFLIAAWIGELELLGFKGLGKALGLVGRGARAATSATVSRFLGAGAAEALTTGLLKKGAIKWLAFVFRAGVTGFEFGTLSVLDLFLTDLFHMTRCKRFSSSEEYWSRFKIGFVIGMGMELLAIPVLAPIARALRDVVKSSTVYQAAAALRSSGKSYGEITKLLLQGSEQIELALGRTLEKPEVTGPLVRGFRQRMMDVLRTYGREYETRAYKSLIQILDEQLSSAASRGLTGLLEAGAEKDLDALIASLVRRKIPPSEMLELLGALEQDALNALVKSGNLARLGESPQLIGFLRRFPKPGWRLLNEIFENHVDELEGYLARIEKAWPQHADELMQNFAAILLRKDNRLPRDVIAALVEKHEGVTKVQLAILDRLQASNVKLSAFAEGRGVSLPDFETAFGKLTPAEQTAALEAAGGQTPTGVLQQAKQTRDALQKGARQMAPTREQLAEDLAAGTRKQARADVKSVFRDGSAHETKILSSVLRKNHAVYAKFRRTIESFNPDAIVGIERGGPFIADAATYGSSTFRGRVIRIPKSRNAYAEAKAEVEALIAGGKKRFAFTDVYFSGSARNKFQNDVIEPLARAHPECEFKGLWVREELGFERGIRASGRPQLDVPKKVDLPNVQNIEHEVPFALGDDADTLLSTVVSEAKPIYVFDETGRILEVFTPKPGETTRDLFFRILWTW